MATEVTSIISGEDMEFTAAANVACGEIIVANGKVGIVKSLQGVLNGEVGIARVRGVAFIPAATGTTFAADANVQFNTSTRLAVASGGTHAGRAFYAKTSGPLGVWVELNKIATA